MKLLIEPPTWLGDAVMASGAIKEVIKYFNAKEVIFLGSFVSIELFKPLGRTILIDKKHRIKQFFSLEKVDVFVSFRSSIYSKILGLKAKKSYVFSKNYEGHQVEKYSKFVNSFINQNKIYKPSLEYKPFKYSKPTIGLNPGATYGSAKRWYPEEFAKVANALGKTYDIIIFGGPGEEDIANDIEKNLTIKNYQNLCAKLSIKELCEKIGGLEMLITNDSGPMHIASAYDIKIVALFGPTKYTETSPYSKNYKIVTKDLECAPCMKRECPLKHHDCMKEISADEVIKIAKELL